MILYEYGFVGYCYSNIVFKSRSCPLKRVKISESPEYSTQQFLGDLSVSVLEQFCEEWEEREGSLSTSTPLRFTVLYIFQGIINVILSDPLFIGRVAYPIHNSALSTWFSSRINEINLLFLAQNSGRNSVPRYRM